MIETTFFGVENCGRAREEFGARAARRRRRPRKNFSMRRALRRPRSPRGTRGPSELMTRVWLASSYRDRQPRQPLVPHQHEIASWAGPGAAGSRRKAFSNA